MWQSIQDSSFLNYLKLHLIKPNISPISFTAPTETNSLLKTRPIVFATPLSPDSTLNLAFYTDHN